METHLVHETLQPANDRDIVAALWSAGAAPAATSSVRVGFRNARGQIYRSATVRGLGQFAELSRRLHELGVDPGPMRPDEMTLGFSSVFQAERPREPARRLLREAAQA